MESITTSRNLTIEELKSNLVTNRSEFSAGYRARSLKVGDYIHFRKSSGKNKIENIIIGRISRMGDKSLWVNEVIINDTNFIKTENIDGKICDFYYWNISENVNLKKSESRLSYCNQFTHKITNNFTQKYELDNIID